MGKPYEKEDRPVRVLKTTADFQRLKVEKLMKNPDRPVEIPERPKQKNVGATADFVRNVMGSSAGAGSGEFHVYRHIRRREYARQKAITSSNEKEQRDEAYRMKLLENKEEADKRTEKKRLKRLKKKAKLKNKKNTPKTEDKKPEEEKEEEEEEESSPEVDIDDEDLS